MTERSRHDSIDLLRGAVMALMALDHTRDFFAGFGSPTDLATTTPALFFTRWITHFCAPVFILLAGVSVHLQVSSGRSTGAVSRFLVTRGLWLVALELTVVRLGWNLNPFAHFFLLQVIWAIGWSMVVLAGLIRLPRAVIAIVGGATVLFHNALDGVHSTHPLWAITHESQPWRPAPGWTVYVAYPLIPWVGVMALGYLLGQWYDLDAPVRRRRLIATGAGLTGLFVLLRAINGYGDPEPWTHQTRALYTVLSFLNCEKYPPSLDYLLMTLGPALVALALLEGVRSPLTRPVLTFGRVPLFYYLVHLPMLQVSAGIYLLARGGFTGLRSAIAQRQNPGLALPGVYLVWIIALAVLYPLCVWFAGVKRRNPAGWLRYL